MTRIPWLLLGAIGVAAAALLATPWRRQPKLIVPYDRSLPIVYDNDETRDVYTDEYLMALASAGEINLVGMITSTSVAPFNPAVAPADYERMVAERADGVRLARRSGMRNIPDPVRGPNRHLERPPSGEIADTRPLDSEGTRVVVEAARQATSDRPLLLVMGGPLTVAADAYLHDSTIADRMILAWVGDSESLFDNYNGQADPWAGYIALRRLRLVMFPISLNYPDGVPQVPAAQLERLPPTELRDWMMIHKRRPGTRNPGRDGDGAPAIALMRPDYVTSHFARVSRFTVRWFEPERVSFSGWVPGPHGMRPAFRPDPQGTALVFPAVRGNVATEEWWRALSNPAAYHPVPGG